MGRSDGREGGGAATAMTAQRRLRRRSDSNDINGNGATGNEVDDDGNGAMGVGI